MRVLIVVVVGSRGPTGLKRIVLGSVARNVVTAAGASVLVVHRPAEARPASELVLRVD